jgi:hypothetical protein
MKMPGKDSSRPLGMTRPVIFAGAHKEHELFQ